jgi:DNA adenine methylase
MNAASQSSSSVHTGANFFRPSALVSRRSSHLSTLQGTQIVLVCTRELASFLCLYGIPRTVNLVERFDKVDIEADAFQVVLKQISQFTITMKGPIGYVGGKSRIATQIIALMLPHKTYVEVFAGGAQVLFHKEPVLLEVLNDIDGDVVTFFRVCQTHHQELIRYARYLHTSREWFDLLLAQDPKLLTDVQRAVRFLFLQKNSYAGAVRNRGFAYAVESHVRFDPERVPELIEQTHKRLARVQIENLPYQDVLRRYDRPGTMFYLDPPYYGLKLYRYNFSEKDFTELAACLRKLKGKFVLSLNDVPQVRKVFADFKFLEIELPYTAQRQAGKRFRELLIANFPLRDRGSK